MKTLALFLALASTAPALADGCSYQELQSGCQSVNDLVGHADGSTSYMCVCPEPSNDTYANCLDAGGSPSQCSIYR
jgi:hypothetical protein